MQKRFFAILLPLLILSLLPTALAVETGAYDWNGYSVTITKVDEQLMFAPAGMTENQRAFAVWFQAPEAVANDEGLRAQLYSQAKLVDAGGAAYAASASAQGQEEPTLMMFLYAIPRDVDIAALTLQFLADAAVPAEYVGDWAGSADGIDLAFTIHADGSGVYTFTQGDYSESYGVTLTTGSETFAADIPKDNKSQITACEGTYAYADGILTLQVKTTFANGREMAYTIPCEPAGQ
jgi:hypothetical protein